MLLCNRMSYFFRHYTTENIQFKVMFGVMDVWSMKYGVWDPSHLKTSLSLMLVEIINCCVIVIWCGLDAEEDR